MIERLATIAVVTALAWIGITLGADETRLQRSCAQHASAAACRQW